ncbi:MAG: hypothetical protein [Caudoviricetes sp.]|nr:MAG: hypothetical protein [Caudoviricetes sp.]
MTAIDNTPSNRNFLSPLNFRFTLRRAPHINFFLQKVSLPQVNINPTPIYSNLLIDIPLAGEFVTFGSLTISFKVDEDLQNYLELFNWIKALGDYGRDGDYAKLQNAAPGSDKGLYSDISLMVLSSTKMPNYEITFMDAFPVSLTALPFNTTDTDVNYVEAQAEFRYTIFEFNNIT